MNGSSWPSCQRAAHMVPTTRPPPLGPLLLLVWGLLVPGTPGQEFPVRVDPHEIVVPEGGSVSVNCSTPCPEPQTIELETAFSKELQSQAPGWAAFLLVDVKTDGELQCSTSCQGSQTKASASVTAYAFPEQMDLAPLPNWVQVGDSFTLSCQVTGGKPRANLTMVLLRGEEEVKRQPAENEGSTFSLEATVEAKRSDHMLNLSCRADLDFRPRGLGLLQSSSDPKKLKTFIMPSVPPQLSLPRMLEVGTPELMTCIQKELFPANEAEIRLSVANQWLDPFIGSQGDYLWANVEITAWEEQAALPALCKVSLAGQTQEAQTTAIVYSFWGPNLTLSEPSALEGSTVNVTCAAGPGVLLILDGIPASAAGQPTSYEIQVTREDNGRNFFCSGSMEVAGELLHRNRSIQLTVLYGPIIDRAKCPQHVTWKDKTTNTLFCEAWGNPHPEVQCVHKTSGRKVPIGVPFFVSWRYNGTYICQASSVAGKDSLMLRIDVQSRNLHIVTIILGVFTVVGLLVLLLAALSAFRIFGPSDSYDIKQKSLSLKPRGESHHRILSPDTSEPKTVGSGGIGDTPGASKHSSL